MSALQLKFPLVFKITDAWSGSITYKPKWNLLAETDRHRLELAATHQWGANNQYALSCGAEVPLTPEGFNFRVFAGFAGCF